MPTELSTEEAKMWSILEYCWGTTPSARAPASIILSALLSDVGRPSTVQHRLESRNGLVVDPLYELKYNGPNTCIRYCPNRPSECLA
jgi:hypothetical protein